MPDTPADWLEYPDAPSGVTEPARPSEWTEYPTDPTGITEPVRHTELADWPRYADMPPGRRHPTGRGTLPPPPQPPTRDFSPPPRNTQSTGALIGSEIGAHPRSPGPHPLAISVIALVIVVLAVAVIQGGQNEVDNRNRSSWYPGYARPDRKDVTHADLAQDVPGWTRDTVHTRKPRRESDRKHSLVAQASYTQGGREVLVTAQFSNESTPGRYLRQTTSTNNVTCGIDKYTARAGCFVAMNRGVIQLEQADPDAAYVTIADLETLGEEIYDASPS